MVAATLRIGVEQRKVGDDVRSEYDTPILQLSVLIITPDAE
jgi:hypothetical protein